LEEFLVASLLFATLIAIGIWGLILLPPPGPFTCGMICNPETNLCTSICKEDVSNSEE